MAKTYVANYLFNYFGEDKVGDKLIRGATIDVAIRPYKNGKLIQFDPKTDPELFEIVDVSFDHGWMSSMDFFMLNIFNLPVAAVQYTIIIFHRHPSGCLFSSKIQTKRNYMTYYI